MGMPDGYMQDSAGRLVPRDKVKPQELMVNDLVVERFDKARTIREGLKGFRDETFDLIHTALALITEQYGTTYGGQKGNITLTSFDGRKRITIAIGDSISFGPELQAAKSLIDSCLGRWSEGADANLKVIVTDAFEVGKEGKIRTDKILGLRRLNIEDAEWECAMQAISDSIRIDATKAYIRFHERDLPDNDFRQVPLDIARA
ncbi:DUF3164 family protein [Komagataeibacter sucrofermentans]|uniref:Sulfate transporter n=1 Tax=Komagataeibacter sucrofermentans TaxID=1053551 RepID=A0A318QIW2_9PROT|nr:DUF3164 family protein [Komagataeibacter sucrofermentans]PYD77431.1 sulfate transporter [Komagataeibacter sucrofermentans]GBQ51585.1 hypothetical protein AA15973_2441 [Komagataeibacter sucrofermentans DSM 15973]